MVESTWAGCSDLLEKKQLAYLLARHGYRCTDVHNLHMHLGRGLLDCTAWCKAV